MSSQKKPKPDERLISKPELLDRVGVSYPTIWIWMREGKFPRSRSLGGKTFWLASDIDNWIANLPMRPLKGDAKAVA
jgi:prophage regulatory protein